METKAVRRVRDPEYWGMPYNTIIVPGMKPVARQSVRRPAGLQPRKNPFGTETRRRHNADGSVGWVKKKVAGDGKPVWEVSYLPAGSAMRQTSYFDNQNAAHDHIDYIMPDSKPGNPVASPRPVSVKKLRAKPFRRAGWKKNADGSFTREQGDVVGRVTPIAHGGAYMAIFTDGRTFYEQEFARSGYRSGGNDYTYTSEQRRDMALAWIDEQFKTPEAQDAIKHPLSERAKKARDKRIKEAIAAGQIDPAMTTAEREAAHEVAATPPPQAPRVITALPDYDPEAPAPLASRSTRAMNTPRRRRKVKIVKDAPITGLGVVTGPDPVTPKAMRAIPSTPAHAQLRWSGPISKRGGGRIIESHGAVIGSIKPNKDDRKWYVYPKGSLAPRTGYDTEIEAVMALYEMTEKHEAPPAPEPPRVSNDVPLASAISQVSEFIGRGTTSAPFRRGKNSRATALTATLPTGGMYVPKIRRQLTNADRIAIDKFERSLDIPPQTRSDLRQLEATGEYRWVHIPGKDMPNGIPAWVFARTEARLTDTGGENSTGTRHSPGTPTVPIGPVLAMSQPTVPNYIYDGDYITETLDITSQKWGDLMPRPMKPDAEGPKAPTPKPTPVPKKTVRKKPSPFEKNRAKKGADMDIEEKGVRHIRTAEGARKYGGQIGDPITLDMVASTVRKRIAKTPTSHAPDAGTPIKPVRLKLRGGPKVEAPSSIGGTDVPDKPKKKSPSGQDRPDKPVDVAAMKSKIKKIGPKEDEPVDDRTLPEQRLEGIDTHTRTAKDFTVKLAAKILRAISASGFEDGEGTPDDPIDCGKDVEKAQRLLAEGKHVRLKSIKHVSILMDKFAELNDEMRANNDEEGELQLRQTYDLCKVHVPKTTIFCADSKGIARADMPQFKGQPVEGSYAEAKFTGKESDVTPEFFDTLDALGIARTERMVNPSTLKATQNELVASQVSGMRGAIRRGEFKPGAIIVTRDGYVVDGHHTWAAQYGLDMEDGKLDDVEMPVIELDADIGYIYDLAMGFTEMAGIKRKGAGKAATAAVKALMGAGMSTEEIKAAFDLVGRDYPVDADSLPCIGCQ